jgi:site-specific DNA-methyltransferase (adenine-specific)
MVEIIQGDCLKSLRNLAPKSVNTCVTSPPYFGLRDYGDEGQLGLEETPEEFVENLVKVFKEVKRVLRDDGTVWLNLGDSYAMSSMRGKNSEFKSISQSKSGIVNVKKNIPHGLKAKDLIGIPWRVAFALQQDGWYLRQDIIWHKPNPMPESVRDHCTKSHEYIFLLSKSKKYYYDNEVIKEDSISIVKKRTRKVGMGVGSNIGTKGSAGNNGKRNKRSVWTVTTKPFKGAHFAVFPMDLIEPCVLAGCPEGGTVLDPFGGSGTTGLVAQNNNRNAILLELNPEYIEIAESRLYPKQRDFLKARVVA